MQQQLHKTIRRVKLCFTVLYKAHTDSVRALFFIPTCFYLTNILYIYIYIYIQSRFILHRTPLRIFITHIYGTDTLRLISMQKYGNVVRFTCNSSVLIFSFCFVNFIFRSLYPSLILNSTFFSEISSSTKRILTPTAISIKEMIISWHQKGKSLKEIADLTGKPRSTVQSIIKKWKETGCVENQWCKGRPSTFSTRDANRLDV